MRIKTMTAPPRYRELEDEIEKVRKDKEDSIENQEFEKAASLRDKERKLTQKKRELEEEWRKEEQVEQPSIGEDEIADIVSMWTGIPVFKLTEAESQKLIRMEDELHKRVIGQDAAIIAVSKAIRRARAGIKDPKRPTGSFIFLGPSGVGKTELARTLAEFLFGDEDSMIQIDMSEYMEKHAVSRLVGSPPGYIGYDEGGQLTEAVRRKPYSVVLFDEIEKAHPDVFNILLQILEDGKLTDAQGRKVDFRNVIVIMTSNIGSTSISKNQALGFNLSDEQGLSYDDMKGRVMGDLKKSFRPELLNRIDEIIVFPKLAKDEILQIVDLMLNRLRVQMAEHEVTLELADEAKEMLVEKGYDPAMGARPLRRAIQRLIEDPLADYVLGRSLEPGSTIVVARKNEEEVDISVVPPSPPAEPAPSASSGDSASRPGRAPPEATAAAIGAALLERTPSSEGSPFYPTLTTNYVRLTRGHRGPNTQIRSSELRCRAQGCRPSIFFISTAVFALAAASALGGARQGRSSEAARGREHHLQGRLAADLELGSRSDHRSLVELDHADPPRQGAGDLCWSPRPRSSATDGASYSSLRPPGRPGGHRRLAERQRRHHPQHPRPGRTDRRHPVADQGALAELGDRHCRCRSTSTARAGAATTAAGSSYGGIGARSCGPTSSVQQLTTPPDGRSTTSARSSRPTTSRSVSAPCSSRRAAPSSSWGAFISRRTRQRLTRPLEALPAIA